MFLISSTKNFLPARALPIPPVMLTSVASPCTLVNSSDSVVQRRNITNAAKLATAATAPPSATGDCQVRPGPEELIQMPATATVSSKQIASHSHEILRMRTGLG